MRELIQFQIGSVTPWPVTKPLLRVLAGKYGPVPYDVDFRSLQSYLGHRNEYLDRGQTYTAVPLDHFKGFLARLTPHQDSPLRSETDVTHAATFRGPASLRFIFDRTRARARAAATAGRCKGKGDFSGCRKLLNEELLPAPLSQSHGRRSYLQRSPLPTS